MSFLKGHFLVASSHLADPNFKQAVVLLIHHSQEGAFGVVLNRPAENTVQELWEKVGEGPCECQQPVHVGGPVSGPLMALHGDESLAEMEVVPGVYFAAQREHLEKLLRQTEHPLRVFVGHAGWAGGQLESEIRQGAWLNTPATAQLVFGDPSDLWRRITQQIGESFLASVLKIKHTPPDPGLN